MSRSIIPTNFLVTAGVPGHTCRGPVIFPGALHNVLPALTSFYHRASWHVVDPVSIGTFFKKMLEAFTRVFSYKENILEVIF